MLSAKHKRRVLSMRERLFIIHFMQPEISRSLDLRYTSRTRSKESLAAISGIKAIERTSLNYHHPRNFRRTFSLQYCHMKKVTPGPCPRTARCEEARVSFDDPR